ncbi:peptidylprolyl isomerase [Hymenobacter sp. GOD-10R]|uniref:peptidylprolyl isomerase n=1 Tax=Hymenobacter sp. GOD-10R TaxID=3093922 RepID=UPI002D794B66|nr:peptidylprolyl isomerase [Hymenobacter sp. GOD-10R]WRQ27479.1 peptidylprolyl isomerase [Hymenobacter sp. GOD-10R]
MKSFVSFFFLATVAVGGFSFGLAACASTAHVANQAAGVSNKFAGDSTLRRLATLQDERRTAALLPYLARPEAPYRREAAFALASVQDKAATVALLPRLIDADASVRKAAAYALGQTADSTAESALQQRISAEPDPTARRYMLEALGRCTSRAGLANLTRLPAHLATDTAALTGQAWGLYRAGLRGLTSEATVGRIVQLVAPTNPYGARLAAANMLARTRNLNLAPYAATLLGVAQHDPSYAVRSAVAASLNKAATAPEVPGVLANLARRDPDYRVRLSAIRAMTAAMYAPVKEATWGALTDKNDQVALSAAEFFLANAKGEPGTIFLENANQLTQWRVRATLLAAALKYGGATRGAIRTAIQQRYAASSDVYEKGYLLRALAEDSESYEFVERAVFPKPAALVIGTYGMEALVSMRSLADFPTEQQPAFALTLQRGIASGDVAIMGIAAEAIRNPKLALRPLFVNSDFLKTARDKLTLPRDLEAWESLQQTIAYLDNTPTTPFPVAKAASHPINWAVVQTIPTTQRATVRTSKGTIVFQLLVNEAPGSVASFVELTRQGFYNGKTIHRVVPNFVAQGGCPRGDGWGSTDYNIRSEFADLRYGEGAVGLASAGKDTESCQWFITHSPTPHLDGRYTIFAQVVSGMEVVSRLEIGDRIERIELEQ